MRLRTLAPIATIGILALAGCSNNPEPTDAGDVGTDQGYTMPSATETATEPAMDSGGPFTTTDNLSFSTSEGSTGHISFNPETVPEDLAQGIEASGQGGGTWASISVDNRDGSDSISEVSLTAFDEAGTKYEMVSDDSVTVGLYGNSEGDDPNNDFYYDLWEKYDSDPGYIEPGETRDFYLYAYEPWPNELVHGYVNAGWGAAPLYAD